MHIFNPYLRFFFSDARSSKDICIRHPFASDIEGDAVYEVMINLDAINLRSVTGASHEYTAYLTGLKLYKADDNPFTDAVELSASEGDETGNYGYPFMPPKVTLEDMSFPMAINIKLHYLDHDTLTTWKTLQINKGK